MNQTALSSLHEKLAPIANLKEIYRGMLIKVQFKGHLAAGYAAEDFNLASGALRLSQSSLGGHVVTLKKEEIEGYLNLYHNDAREVICEPGLFQPQPGELIETVREGHAGILEQAVGYVNLGYDRKVTLSLFSPEETNGNGVPHVHVVQSVKDILLYRIFD